MCFKKLFSYTSLAILPFLALWAIRLNSVTSWSGEYVPDGITIVVVAVIASKSGGPPPPVGFVILPTSPVNCP